MSDPNKLTTLGHLRTTAERIDEQFIDVDELQAVQEANDEKFIDVDELTAVKTKIEQSMETKVSVEMDFANNTLIFTTK